MPKYLTIREAQQQLPKLSAQLNDGPAIITDNGQPVMVAISLEQFTSLLETIDIMSDSEFMAALRQGIQQAEAGETISLEELKKELGF